MTSIINADVTPGSVTTQQQMSLAADAVRTCVMQTAPYAKCVLDAGHSDQFLRTMQEEFVVDDVERVVRDVSALICQVMPLSQSLRNSELV